LPLVLRGSARRRGEGGVGMGGDGGIKGGWGKWYNTLFIYCV
jgi:hypothetical protein